MVGYKPQIHPIVIAQTDTSYLKINLSPTTIEMPGLIVSASKRPVNIVDVPTSVTLIDARTLATQNTISLDQSLDYAPGVNMVSGQVSIRGSSGYSRGTGSRVLLLIDGFPALSADNGEIKWDAIPMDQIARVEIVKGAGSALYGTGALGGIINVITYKPTTQPKTRFRTWMGTYSKPTYPEWAWTTDRRYVQGVDMSHSQTIDDIGFVVGIGQKWTNGYRENDWHKRYKTFAKIQKKFSQTRTLTTTLNWAYDDHGVFIQWKDRNEPLEVPVQNGDDRTLSTKFNANMDYYHLIRADLGYRIKTFVYRTHFKNDLEGNAFSTGYKFGQEYQLDAQPTASTSLTSGIEWISNRVQSPNNLFGDHTGYSLAAYTQAELEPSKTLLLSVGARYDRGKLDGRDPAGRFSPKIGLSWQIAPTTSLRSTLGWGFRNPSIAEIYTNTEFSGVPIVPNPSLKPERSISFESGLIHQFSWMHVDIAGFYSRYNDLIEARPEVAGTVSFRNVSQGRIVGLEVSTQIALGFLTLDGDYTLLDAVESLPTGSLSLPYRSRHVAGGGVITRYKNLLLSSRYTYRSTIKQGATGLFPEGTRDLIAVHLLDLSFSYELSPLTITFTIHNTLEYNYARTERNLGPPRRFTLNLAGEF